MSGRRSGEEVRPSSPADSYKLKDTLTISESVHAPDFRTKKISDSWNLTFVFNIALIASRHIERLSRAAR